MLDYNIQKRDENRHEMLVWFKANSEKQLNAMAESLEKVTTAINALRIEDRYKKHTCVYCRFTFIPQTAVVGTDFIQCPICLQAFPTTAINKPRWEFKRGRFGCYLWDNELKIDVDLKQTAELINTMWLRLKVVDQPKGVDCL